MGINQGKIIFLSISLMFIYQIALGEQRYRFNKTDRDPFSPLVREGGLIAIPRQINIGNLILGGIIYSEKESLAIINDQVLKEGATMGDYTVFKIEEKQVILKKDNEEFSLKLEEE